MIVATFKTDGVDVIEREDGEDRTEAIRITSADDRRLVYVCGSAPFEAGATSHVTAGDWTLADKLIAFLNAIPPAKCDHDWTQTAGGVECTICHSSMPGTP